MARGACERPTQPKRVHVVGDRREGPTGKRLGGLSGTDARDSRGECWSSVHRAWRRQIGGERLDGWATRKNLLF
jgi:hypothetical protein